MNNYENVKELETGVGVAVGVVVTEYTTDFITQMIKIPGSTIIWLIIVIALSIALSRYVLGIWFNHSKILRKLLIGNQFIEGTWFDTMKTESGIIEIGFSRIKYSQKKIDYWGEDYDLVNHQTSPYDAIMVKLEWPDFHYIYSAYRTDKDEENTKGYGKLSFERRPGNCPKKYTGKYIAFGGSRNISFIGIKLDEKEHKEWIAKLDKPELRKKCLQELHKKFNKQENILP